MLDGIQMSSGCTLGKGNLQVRNASRVQARFRKGNRSLFMTPTEKAARLLHSIARPEFQDKIRELALSLNRIPDDDLFVVKPSMRA